MAWSGSTEEAAPTLESLLPPDLTAGTPTAARETKQKKRKRTKEFQRGRE